MRIDVTHKQAENATIYLDGIDVTKEYMITEADDVEGYIEHYVADSHDRKKIYGRVRIDLPQEKIDIGEWHCDNGASEKDTISLKEKWGDGGKMTKFGHTNGCYVRGKYHECGYDTKNGVTKTLYRCDGGNCGYNEAIYTEEKLKVFSTTGRDQTKEWVKPIRAVERYTLPSGRAYIDKMSDGSLKTFVNDSNYMFSVVEEAMAIIHKREADGI